MKAWKEDDIHTLLHEGRTMQSRLATSNQNMRTKAQMAQSFARLVYEGKIRPAIRRLTEQSSGEKMNLNDYVASTGSGGEPKTVQQVLAEKHPKGHPLRHSTLVNADTTSQEPHPVMLEQVNGAFMQFMILP